MTCFIYGFNVEKKAAFPRSLIELDAKRFKSLCCVEVKPLALLTRDRGFDPGLLQSFG